jgi:hypothetical protein
MDETPDELAEEQRLGIEHMKAEDERYTAFGEALERVLAEFGIEGSILIRGPGSVYTSVHEANDGSRVTLTHNVVGWEITIVERDPMLEQAMRVFDRAEFHDLTAADFERMAERRRERRRDGDEVKLVELPPSDLPLCGPERFRQFGTTTFWWMGRKFKLG